MICPSEEEPYLSPAVYFLFYLHLARDGFAYYFMCQLFYLLLFV
jgi:hypothetical protein